MRVVLTSANQRKEVVGRVHETRFVANEHFKPVNATETVVTIDDTGVLLCALVDDVRSQSCL